MSNTMSFALPKFGFESAGFEFPSFAACKDTCTHAMDLSPVTDGISTAFGVVKEWSNWIGREVVVLASKGFSLAKDLATQLLTLVKACWELSKPWINRTIDFVKSNTGVVFLGVTSSLLLGALALKLDDHPAQVALLTLSYLVGGFFLIYGCQTGVIPQFV